MLDHAGASVKMDLPVWEDSGLRCPLGVPSWVSGWLDSATGGWSLTSSGLRYRVFTNDQATLVSIVGPEALSLSEAAFRERTVEVYRLLDEQVGRRQGRHLVRVWNFIPQILAPLGASPERYWVFNTGRHAAYREWCQGDECFESDMATASGVGHPGAHLLVHGLAITAPGRAVENPRQTPSYCYSARYGPVPPCFARATRVTFGPQRDDLLLVGGTASVRGEATVHAGDLRAQIDETCRNLASLVNTVRATEGDEESEALARYRHLRVYHARGQHRAQVAQHLTTHFPNAVFEWVRADLCRRDLLIEIEGVAALGEPKETPNPSEP